MTTTISAQLAAIRAKAQAALNPPPQQRQADDGSRSLETRQRQEQLQKLHAKRGLVARGKPVRLGK